MFFRLNAYKYLLLCVGLCLVSTSFAIGWGEYTVIFQNKHTGEYKKTYQMLYRLDFDSFRDNLARYCVDRGIPNNNTLKDWNVVYHKYCDREDCTTLGTFANTQDFYRSISDMMLADISSSEYFWINLEYSLVFKIFLIIGAILLVYKYRPPSPQRSKE